MLAVNRPLQLSYPPGLDKTAFKVWSWGHCGRAWYVDSDIMEISAPASILNYTGFLLMYIMTFHSSSPLSPNWIAPRVLFSHHRTANYSEMSLFPPFRTFGSHRRACLIRPMSMVASRTWLKWRSASLLKILAMLSRNLSSICIQPQFFRFTSLRCLSSTWPGTWTFTCSVDTPFL